MITKIKITDNTNTPVSYLPDVFENGFEVDFKPGVNIIVGENGCGKTTLMNLLKRYLMVDYNECGKGEFNCNINRLFGSTGGKILDGVDVYADYRLNTFRFSHPHEKQGGSALKDFRTFGETFTNYNSSTGQGVLNSLNCLFELMFGKDVKLTYDYNQFSELYPEYVEYVKTHRIKCPKEITILMDEPDRNLSLENISQIKGILSYHKESTQIIAVIHNPLLIYSLNKFDHINWIELTKKYCDKVNKEIKKLING